MKFHEPLDDLLGSKERIRLLRFLVKYPKKESTSNELSRYCNVSTRSTIDILTCFKEIGFVESKRKGNAILWNLNENHVIFKFLLRPLFKGEANIFKQLASDIRRSIPAEKIILFGSVSKGEEKHESDLDLFALVRSKDKIFEKSVGGLQNKLLKEYGNLLSLVAYTPREYAKMNKTLKEDIEKGIVIK